MTKEPYLRIAVVHDDGTTAIYHVAEIRLESESFTLKTDGYFVTILPTKDEENR